MNPPADPSVQELHDRLADVREAESFISWALSNGHLVTVPTGMGSRLPRQEAVVVVARATLRTISHLCTAAPVGGQH